ncbi:MAG: M28 family peptidase [Planctomycetota bacterium]|nr:M28 family peptidase [Planctomycetota bacterium]MDG2144858.1 M28 family peptidase [Planctomycetota bacterium]
MSKDRARSKLIRRVSLAALVAFLAAGLWIGCSLARVADMPGESYGQSLEPWSADDHALGTTLEASVRSLTALGPRSTLDEDARAAAGAWILQQLQVLGLVVVAETFVPAIPDEQGLGHALLESPGSEPVFTNYIVPLGGPADAPLLVLSAHYDTVPGSVGADDDASGVAALLELAARLASDPIPASKQRYRLELCFFDGEEAGYERMGSGHHARKLASEGKQVAGAISLEMLGYFTEAPGTQDSPSALLGPFYPSAGNFIAFVGSEASGDFIRESIGAFRTGARFPSEGLVAPDSILDVRRSDHVHFVDQGWPGFMVTDTANFRNPHYHRSTDTPDQLDYLALGRVTRGIEGMIRVLATKTTP